MKNYFIKDEALKSVDQDSFGHVDIANNIKNMIEYTDAPFNVAIIGKWGMGKSSLINMLKKVLEQDQTDVYMIQEINAWKYQKVECIWHIPTAGFAEQNGRNAKLNGRLPFDY